MPYRRLPNTDAARIRAMRTALEKGKEQPPYKVSISAKTIVKLQKFLPRFEHHIHLYRQTLASQNKKSKEYSETLSKAKMYLSHFIRVMNMAVSRGDLPGEARAYFGLATDDLSTPSFSTEKELMTWGRRIIEGEEFRIRKGGSPITNPTIAVVKVRFENFLESWTFNKTISKRTSDLAEKISELRKEADDIILNLWNEIEISHADLDEDLRKRSNEEYGLVYFFRKGEQEKDKVAKTDAR
jgi:hypothetical protein